MNNQMPYFPPYGSVGYTNSNSNCSMELNRLNGRVNALEKRLSFLENKLGVWSNNEMAMPLNSNNNKDSGAYQNDMYMI